jgi:hypothetical protein
MNKLKEEKTKNYDATDLVGREIQSPYQAPFIPAPSARQSKTTTLVKNDLDIY